MRRAFHAVASLAFILTSLLVTAQPGLAQQGRRYTITGNVLQADGAPLAGAQVLVRGTSQGSLTNAQGRYSIEAALPPGRYTLQAQFIGRRTGTRDVTLADQRTVDAGSMTLEESALQLEELVVTGPGAATERRALGNAVSSVSGEQVNRAPGTSSAGIALQGKITGALITQTNGQPGGAVTIRLRGTNAILGTAEPLIVVDGVIADNTTDALIGISVNVTGANRSGGALSNRLSEINAADIDRVEVLKGAAAAALYGSRAKNGVILITTKRGQQGAARVTWGTQMEINSTPKKYEFNASPKAGLADLAIAGSLIDPVTHTLGLKGPTGAPLVFGDPVTRYDYQNQIWQTGVGANTQMSVSGGSGGTTYFLSGNYRDDEGIVRTSSSKKYSVRAKVTQQLSNNLEVTANGNYIRNNTRFVLEGENSLGVLTSIIFTPTVYNPAFNGDIGRYPLNPINGPNPFDILENWDSPESVSRFVGNAEVAFHPFSSLALKYLFGFDDFRLEDRLFTPPFAVSATSTGSVTNPVRLSTNYNHDLSGTLNSRINDSFTLQSLGGFRYTQANVDNVFASGTNLSPGQILVGGASQASSQTQTELRTESFFLQEQLGFADQLFVTGGANYEASSAFGANERWQLFKRLGVSWVLNDRAGYKESALGKMFPTLRLRAGFGETGGQPPTLYDRFANYNTTSYSGKPGLTPSTIAANPNLKPERQREIEGGFEAGFLKDRVSVEATYYSKKTTDFVLGVPLPLSSGFTTQRQNIGAVSNHGLELTLNTVNVERDKFSWRSRIGFSRDRNKVTKLVTSRDSILFGYLNWLIEGQPVGVFYGGQYARDGNGNITYVDTTIAALPGRIVRLPKRMVDTVVTNGVTTLPFVNGIIGDPNPDWTASFQNTITLGRNLEFGFLFDGRFGNDVANFTRRITELFGSDKTAEMESNGDTIPGTFSRSPTGRINIYEEYIEDGSFVKLRELSLSYRVDKPWVRRLGASTMTLRAAGRNLKTWTKYRGLDPEVNLFGASGVAQGVDFANTPLPRTWAFGVNFNF